MRHEWGTTAMMLARRACRVMRVPLCAKIPASPIWFAGGRAAARCNIWRGCEKLTHLRGRRVPVANCAGPAADANDQHAGSSQRDDRNVRYRVGARAVSLAAIAREWTDGGIFR